MTHPRAETPPRSNRLLGPDDPRPLIVTNPGGSSAFLLIGDHAGRAIPRSLDGLGLAAERLDLHIAWDIGVAGMGRRLSAALDACFIQQTYSRLVIDCNRRPDAADSIVAISDSIPIPGNADLAPSDRERRRAEIYQPYQDAIAAWLEARRPAGDPMVLIALHSFTPVFQGHARPWRMGVLHRNDSRLSMSMLALLSDRLGEAVGDNQPYRMDEIDNTVPLHADPSGLDYLELEVRQDLIESEAGQDWAAGLIAELLPIALAAGFGRT